MITMPTLLVDPDADAVSTLAARLRHDGIPTVVAVTRTAALTAIRAEYFGSIVVIANLGNVQCRGCLVDIRRAAAHTWLVVIADYEANEARRHFQNLGVDVFLSLPFSVADLVQRLLSLSVRGRPAF